MNTLNPASTASSNTASNTASNTETNAETSIAATARSVRISSAKSDDAVILTLTAARFPWIWQPGTYGFLAAVMLLPCGSATAGIEADFEAGVVAASRNDVRFPGAGGSDLSLVDDLSAPPSPMFRLRIGYRFAERHLITALYAPLQLNATGVLESDASFAGQTYSAGSSVLGVYRFDSYRLTYRYSFVRNSTFEIAGGLTGKIRDAEISLYGEQPGQTTNTGFVPLLNLHLEWRPGAGAFGVVLDADALAAPQGRAEDLLLAATWTVNETTVLRVGYRTVEGGTDIAEVYNSTWLHYAVGGVVLRF